MALYRCWSTSDGGGGAPLDGDAQESEVLLGKAFYSDSDEKKTGTMPNNGKVDVTLDPDEEWTIPEGYHDGTGTVYAAMPLLTGNATDEQVLAGRTFYNNDFFTKETGSMPNIGQVSITLQPGDDYDIPKGYHDGTGNVYANMPDMTGDAYEEHVVAGKTFYTHDCTYKQTGTMIDNGAVTPANLNCGQYYQIPQGYHNGQGRVTANSLTSQTGVDEDKNPITSYTVLEGKQGWVDGSKVTGAMPNIGEVHKQLDATTNNQTYRIPQGYHNGNGSVYINIEERSGNTAITPSTSQQIVTPSSGKVLSRVVVNAIDLAALTRVDSGKSPITSSKVLTGYQGWVNGSKVTGSMPNIGQVSITLQPGEEYDIPEGYHNGSGNVYANYPELSGNAYEEHVLSGKTFYNYDYSHKWTGSMPDKTGWTATGTAGQKTYIPEGYHDGNGYVSCPSSGGEMTSETLWTNPSPSSTFAAQTITLSKSLTANNYKYIGIEYRCSQSYANTMEILVTPTQLQNSGSTYYPTICLGSKVASSSGRRFRWVEYVGSTQLSFTTGHQDGSSTTNSGWAIPTKIKGYK